MSSPAEVTLLLRAWRAGDAEADEPLIEVLYRELSDMAHRRLERERPGRRVSYGDLDRRAQTLERKPS